MSRQGIVTAALLTAILSFQAFAQGGADGLFGNPPGKAPYDAAKAQEKPPLEGVSPGAERSKPPLSPRSEAPVPVSETTPVMTAAKPDEQPPQEAVHDISLEKNGKGLDAVVSVRIRGLDLATAVRLLAEQAGVNVAVGESVSGTVSCTLNKVTVRTALESFLRSNDYSCVERGGVLIVVKETKLRDFDKNMVARRIERKTFRLPYTGQEKEFTAGEAAPRQSKEKKAIDETIREMLSARGKLVYYPRQHLIVVQDDEDVVAMVADFVKALWATPEQVFIDSKLLEITLEEGEDYGLRWNVQKRVSRAGRTDDKTGAAEVAGTVVNSTAPTLALDRFFSYGLVNANMEVVLEALSTHSRVDLRSNPSVLVMNHRTATIIVGQEVPYTSSEESTGGNPIRTVEFKEVAVRLDVTPHVSENGMVFMDVHPAVKSVIGYTEDPRQPIISTREAVTNVAIADGSTLIVGGLVQRNTSDAISEAPFLSKIPLLGLLFKQKSYSDTKNDLVFLLTPRIVTPEYVESQLRQKEHLTRPLPKHPLSDKEAGKTPWWK